MMNKDPGTISSVLDFFSKKLDKFVDIAKNIDEDYQKTKEILRIESTGMAKNIFYNVKADEFDGKSLLEYIDLQNVRLTRQREELIDLSIKIAKLNNEVDTEDTTEAMEEVFKHYKSGLPSGVGLRDMIELIKERFPWSSSKKIIKIFVSLVTCLFAIGLYALDLTTDVQFSLNIFYRNVGNKTSMKIEDFDDFLAKHSFNFSSLKSSYHGCYANMNATFNEKNHRSSSILTDGDYRRIGWFSLWHCIQPFVATFLVLVSMNYRRCCQTVFQCSVPDIPKSLADSRACQILNRLLCLAPFKVFWPLGCLLYKGLTSFLSVLGRRFPIPVLTKVYRFYLDVRCHYARSKPDFRIKIVSIEEEIREHEALGKL